MVLLVSRLRTPPTKAPHSMDRPCRRLATWRARVGERWVIRHRLADGSATDVIGWIDERRASTRSSWPPSGIDSTRSRSLRSSWPGGRRRPPGARIHCRTSAADLEQIALPGWLALHEPLGEWTLRAAGGFTGRGNSCLAVGDPGLPLPTAAARIVRYAAEHGIPPWAQVITGSPEEQGLVALGWHPTYVPTDVLVARLGDFLGETLPDPQVQVSEQLDEDWERGYDESRPNHADPDLLRMILDGQPPRAFASARRRREGVRHRARPPEPGAGSDWPRSGPGRTTAGAAGPASS